MLVTTKRVGIQRCSVEMHNRYGIPVTRECYYCNEKYSAEECLRLGFTRISDLMYLAIVRKFPHMLRNKMDKVRWARVSQKKRYQRVREDDYSYSEDELL